MAAYSQRNMGIRFPTRANGSILKGCHGGCAAPVRGSGWGGGGWERILLTFLFLTAFPYRVPHCLGLGVHFFLGMKDFSLALR